MLRDSLARVFSRRDDPAALPAADETWLEIGFGGGEHLLEQARRSPGALVIGCEPYEDGVIKVLTAIARRCATSAFTWAIRSPRALGSASLDRAFT